MKKAATSVFMVMACSLLLLSSKAEAEPHDLSITKRGPDHLASKDTAFKVDGGLFSAVGFGGFGLLHAPIPELILEGAVGYGFTGFQFSFMPKLVLGSAADRFITGFGLALAVGGVLESPGCWLNWDALGYEHRFEGGFSLSFALGVTVGLFGGEMHSDMAPKDISGGVLPQGRFSFGYWF